jgi:hypothetical protein
MHSADTVTHLITTLGLVVLAVCAIVLFLWLFTRGLQALSGLSPLEERYPAANKPNAELALGNVWLVGNFWLLGGADEQGIYFAGTLAGQRLVFVPWSELRLVLRLPGFCLFRVRQVREWVFVRQALVRTIET